MQGDAAHGFRAELEGSVSGTLQARLVIGAFGRRAPRWLGVAPVPPQRAAIALKAHLRVAPDLVPPHLALHAFAGGYIGVAPIAADRINLCLVAERGARRALAPGGARAALAGFVARVPDLGALWERAEIVPASVCAASGLRFGRVHPTHGDVLLAGDAAGQPHPASGDGIAMALRSGRLAAACTRAVLERRLPPEQLANVYAQAWRREFTSRLRWARFVHAALARPAPSRSHVGRTGARAARGAGPPGANARCIARCRVAARNRTRRSRTAGVPMRSLSFLVCVAALVAESVAGEPLLLQLDPAASRVEYHITHTLKDVTDVAGTPSGHVRIDTTAGAWNLEGHVTVDLRALVTGNGTRDRHVKSDDYLDVEKFPSAEFRFLQAEADSSLVIAADSVAAAWVGRVRGPLTLHGVERTLEVPVRLDAVPGRDGALRARGRFVLQLADFGIPQPKKLGLSAGKSVDVRVDLVFAP